MRIFKSAAHVACVLLAAGAIAACSSSDASAPGTGNGTEPDRPPNLGKADAWDYKNNPQKFADFLDKDITYAMADLPREGVAKNTPWPDTYWPTYQDSTNHRWQGAGTLSPLEKFDKAFNNWEDTPEFMALKPFDGTNCSAPWDPEYYDRLGPAAKFQSANKGNARSRDGVDSDGDGTADECDSESNDGVESWWGLCHAWVPAAMNEPEPKFPVEHNGVTFYPADIKALLLTVYDRSKSIIVGGRCNTKDPERDETGRIKDDSCRDTNAGAFHVIVTNFLGRYEMSIAEDRTYDYQVWNQPVHDYKITKNEEIDAAQANTLLGVSGSEYQYNPDAKRFFEIQMTMRYVTESDAEDHPLVPSIGSYLRTDKYHYVVEADADGKVIGGEWVAPGSTHSAWGFSKQPDFLWTSVGPAGEITSNPHVKYSVVKMLNDKAQIDPSAPPPPPSAGICGDKCSSSSPQTVDGSSCYCDDACFQYGDCCEGRAEACGGPATGGSCQGHCGQTDNAPGSSPPNLCYCDAGCVNRADCCTDYGTHCN